MGHAHIANELTLAFGRLNERKDIQILPLKIGKFQEPDWVHYFLALIQISPFYAQPNAQQLNQLVARIAQLLNRKQLQKTLPSPKQNPSQPKIIDSGKCGNSVAYTVDVNRQLVISGSGPMWNYTWKKSAPWRKFLGIAVVRIEKGVTSIGDYAFYECAVLKHVHIPPNVTSIGRFTFSGCVKLTGINIPESVMSIGDYAFLRCAMTTVYIPAKARTGLGAFDKHTWAIRY